MADFKIKGGILCYPNLFVPKMNTFKNAAPRPGQKARYDCEIRIPRDIDLTEVQAAAFDLLMTEKTLNGDAAVIKQLIQDGSIRWPFKTRNLKSDGSKRFDDTKFKMTINPWSYDKPSLLDCYGGPDGLPLVLTDAQVERLYSGCVVTSVVNPFWYKNDGGRGVALGLRSVQFWDDGERLDNKPPPVDRSTFETKDRPEVEVTAGDGSPAPTGTGRGAALQDLFA